MNPLMSPEKIVMRIKVIKKIFLRNKINLLLIPVIMFSIKLILKLVLNLNELVLKDMQVFILIIKDFMLKNSQMQSQLNSIKFNL